MFLPYLMGERSPVNDTKVRGAFTGLSMNTSKDEMTLAVLEGVAFAFRQNIDIIRSLGVNITKSKVCGGGAKNRLWLSILANVLNITLQIPEFEHGGVLGAAMLGAPRNTPKRKRRFIPSYGRFTPMKRLLNTTTKNTADILKSTLP